MANKKIKIEGTNAEILQAIAESDEKFADGVGEIMPTTASYEAAYTAITSNQTTMNAFVEGLTNLIGTTYMTQARQWISPLRNLMRDYLMYGDTVEEIAVNIFEAHNYKVSDDANPGKAFKQNPPDVVAMFHRVNSEKLYECTFNNQQLKKAFLAENGLARFMETALTQLYNSSEYNKYESMKKVLADAYKTGKMRWETITLPSTKDETATLIEALRGVALKMGFMNSDYNVHEIVTHTPMQDIRIFMTPDMRAKVDVEVLAMAFNIDKAEFLGQVVIVDSFDKPNTTVPSGLEFVIADKDAFMCMPYVYETRSIYDPRHLALNVYLHDHNMFSFSEFVNCYGYSTVEKGNPTAVTVTSAGSATSVTRGQTLAMTAAVTGDATNGNKVYWYISGATSNDTYISDEGTLYCASDENVGNVITVKAYAIGDPQIVGTKEITVA